MASKSHDLTHGPLVQQIILFSLPLMATNVLQVLFNMSDVAVVGQFAGPEALGSVGSTSILVSLFTGFLIGMGSGINVVVARYIGARHDQDVHEAVHTSLILSLIVGVIIMALGFLFTPAMLSMLGTKPVLMAGAGKRKRIIHSYFISMVFSFGIALVMSALLVIFGRQFLGIFTNVEEVAQAGMIRLRIMGCSYAFSAFMDCTIAANRGLGKSFVPTVIVIMGSCVFRIIWVYTVFAYFHTIESLYLLYIVSWAITATAEMICLRRVYREQMQKLPPDIDGVKATA